MAALSESRQNGITIALLALMLAAFAALSYGSARTKSATADEPLHAIAGFMRVHYGDFRIDIEDPPLFMYWAMLPHPGDVLKVDLTTRAWDFMLLYPWSQFSWVGPTMYRTPGFDPETFLNRSRAMMSALGVMLGIIIAWWAWSLGGRVAALIACALYCFDPNFLGHASLVKNDVPLALVMTALLLAIYRAGGRVTLLRIAAIALLTAAALTVKFSGILLVPMLIALLVARIFIARPWLVLGRIVTSRSQKMMVVLTMIVFTAGASYVGIWAAYGFRYSITTDPDARMNMPILVRATVRNRLIIGHPEDESPSEDAIAEGLQHPPRVARVVVWLNDHRLFPEPWLGGLLDTYATTIRRWSFLMGDYRDTGWWYYFPLAMLFKSPLATIAAVIFAVVLSIRTRFVKRIRHFDRWTTCCLAIPIVIYGASALTSNLNLGVRHILPIVPLVFIWTGVTIAQARALAPRSIAASVAILGAALLAESISAAPNYIAFFNIAAGGSRGGLRLLGDSNLDWGQDLPLLRRWQREHPDVDLILDYFGGADPNYYVQFTPLIVNGVPPNPGALGRDGVSRRKMLAISASKLQGIYPPLSLRPFYAYIRAHRPMQVLGGTIYLYELPLQE
jgi:hypothetical protein